MNHYAPRWHWIRSAWVRITDPTHKYFDHVGPVVLAWIEQKRQGFIQVEIAGDVVTLRTEDVSVL